MTQEKLGRILSSVAKQMRADFEQSREFKHSGEAGTSREVLVTKFLANYLPAHVEAIHNAEIISVTGETSRQGDIVVVDRGAPPFTTLEGYRILPNECVYGVIEVKTRLDKADLIDACEKISAARRLPKAAYRPETGPIRRTTSAYGNTYDHYPTSGIIVAYEGLSLETLGNHLMEWCSSRAPMDWPDSVWVLGKGHLQWVSPLGLLERSPYSGVSLAQIDVWKDQDLLLPLALHLNVHFSEAWMKPLDLIPYAGSGMLGTFSRKWDFS
ncbi:DUF6602 domain-containing protein [Streptomyces katrae]|uniref:DUF6602 domain-containing protein n=1 Tax=Streptomyces katrae TaxID=68223 RepID=UPI000AA0049A|nr:DUF6602 domain-containing protein [Streptomyces katrae]